ncbi:hypothetical protein [Myceligenerans crystallogenes]|uniref:hypothetical protein n=1 Tax=Myceligenerans crystallogenes TaxID=316335 RepID=UPI0031DD7606
MFTRAVILPATPLLVPGAAGAADPLRDVRLAACAALAGLAASGPPMVLAPGPHGFRGPAVLRPTFAAAGIADAALPADVTAPWAVERELAGTASSVLLFCLGMALGEDAARVPVLEIPATAAVVGRESPQRAAGDDAEPGSRAASLHAAAGVVGRHLAGGGTLVAAAGGTPGPAAVAPADPGAPHPGIAELLALAAPGLTAATRPFPQEHDHLPAEYALATLG